MDRKNTVSFLRPQFNNMVKSTQKRFKANLRKRFQRGIRSSLLHQERFVNNRMQNINENIDSSMNDESYNLESGTQKLRMWAVNNNITRNALSELLKILFSFGLTWLPMDYRTLLETPKHTSVISLASGQMWYNGIAKNIRQIFSKLNENIELRLNVNFDGIPIFKSAKKQFWPILANFHGKYLFLSFKSTQTHSSMSRVGYPSIKPIIIAVWYGESKPDPVNDFLFAFVREANELIVNGIILNGRQIKIRIRCFIADTPARSLLKGIFAH